MAETFSTFVLQAEGMKATGIPVPAEVLERLGTSKRPAVAIRIGDYSYRSTVSRMGERYMIPLSSEHRAASGLAAGDEIEVTLELDTAPRVFEVPDDLAAALDAAPAAKAAYEALPPSHKKAHITAVLGAKAPETRARRVAKAIEQLAG